MSKSNLGLVSTIKTLPKYTERNKAVGQYRVDTLKAKYETKGYKVETFAIESEGLDMIAQNEEEVIGFEITNWNMRSYLSMKRLDSMKGNWQEFEDKLRKAHDVREYRRILAYSFSSNIELVLHYLERIGVELLEFGYQELPKEEKIEGWKNATS